MQCGARVPQQRGFTSSTPLSFQAQPTSIQPTQYPPVQHKTMQRKTAPTAQPQAPVYDSPMIPQAVPAVAGSPKLVVPILVGVGVSAIIVVCALLVMCLFGMIGGHASSASAASDLRVTRESRVVSASSLMTAVIHIDVSDYWPSSSWTKWPTYGGGRNFGPWGPSGGNAPFTPTTPTTPTTPSTPTTPTTPSTPSSSSGSSSTGSTSSSSGSATKITGYMIADSNSRYLSSSELSKYSTWELYIARNEIYARHGRGFQNEDLQQYFNRCTWYKKLYEPEEFDDGLLSSLETTNAVTILEVERERNSPYI